MKRLLLIFIFSIVFFEAFSQLIVRKEDNPNIVFGFHTAGDILFGKDTLDNKYHTVLLETEPFVCFFPITNLGFGIMFDYMYANTNVHDFKDFYSVGLMSRYYVPFQINRNMLNKHKIYFECNINYTNYQILRRNVYPDVYNDLSVIRYNFVTGLSLNLINEFYIDFALQ